MARPILLSNSQLHVGLNIYGLVHDFYFPYVGLENHAASKHLRHNIGVFVDGAFHWLDDGTWDISPDYYGDVLVSRIIAINEELEVRLEFDDCVDSDFTALLRNIHVINTADNEREIRLFMHQVFVISDSNASDTVQYIPEEHSILHYKGHRAFLVNGVHSDGAPFDDYSVGLFDTEGHEGTFRDAEDGVLMKNNVEHGRVDSVIGFHLTIPSHSSKRVHYWIAAGRSEREAKKINTIIKTDGLLHHLLKTANWWSEWIKPTKKIASKLPEKHRTSFIRSALIIKAQTDKHGAVIASTDTTMLNYSRDAYAYCWPRDAAYVLWPLMRIGYTDELLHFFAFARRSLHDDGYLAHKYQADGAVGSSWHPYLSSDGVAIPPIQTDETALVLFLFGQYYRMHAEPELLASFYVTLIKPMANFLTGYVSEDGLPLASYDLWEEKHLTSTYTTAVTYASLVEAAYLADVMGDGESAIRWQAAGEKMLAARDVFYNVERAYFYKGYTGTGDKRQFDSTIDSSSLFGAFMFGYFGIDDEKVTSSYETLKNTLMTDGARVIRYEDDAYRRNDGDPSNPWPVTSLWYAQYALEKRDRNQATAILDWVQSVMFRSGVIAEQYDPHNKPLSVAPLAWSQAEYMNALLDMVTDPGDRA
jgi:GH15 family glucan-1,4-alpha-glucosidase